MFEIGSVSGGGSGVLADLTAAVDALLAADPTGVSAVDQVGDIAGLHTQIQRLYAAMADRVRAADTAGACQVAGYRTVGAMLTDGLRLHAGQGQAMAATARVLAGEMPATGAALAAGNISYAHAVQAARAVRKLPADKVPEAEPHILEVAAAGTPSQVRAAVDRIAAWLDPAGTDADIAKRYARRHLFLSQTLDGWWALDAHLPADIGARLSAALADFAAPTGPDDLRTAAQRRADAIGEIADAAVDGTTTGITAVTITADADHLDGVGATFDPTGMPVGLVRYDLAVCQSRLTLVVAKKDGIGWKPLAVGRLTRYATPTQRAALHRRDGGCAYRGCTRPSRRCHAHHIVDWRAGGLTDLDNLILLCAYHHRMVHLGRAVIITDPDTPGRPIAIPARRHTTTVA